MEDKTNHYPISTRRPVPCSRHKVLDGMRTPVEAPAHFTQTPYLFSLQPRERQTPLQLTITIKKRKRTRPAQPGITMSTVESHTLHRTGPLECRQPHHPPRCMQTEPRCGQGCTTAHHHPTLLPQHPPSKNSAQAPTGTPKTFSTPRIGVGGVKPPRPSKIMQDS